MLFEEFQDYCHGLHLSGIVELTDFSNSESPCHPDASHQVSAQSDLRFERKCGLKNFKMAIVAAILDIGILAILKLHKTPVPPIKFQLIPTYCS